jgi:hypothetical protein
MHFYSSFNSIAGGTDSAATGVLWMASIDGLIHYSKYSKKIH